MWSSKLRGGGGAFTLFPAALSASAFLIAASRFAAMEEFKGNVKLARTSEFWPKNNDVMQPKWDAFKAAGKVNEAKPKDDPTRIDPGQFYNTNWVQKYKKELSFTSDKRYHYLGSGACYHQMGESMGKGMLINDCRSG